MKKKQKMVSRIKNIKGLTVITTMNTPSFSYRIVFGNAVQKTIMAGNILENRHQEKKVA